MKFSLIILLIVQTYITYGQQPKNINNIKEVKTLNIYGNNSKITIGKIIVNQTERTKLLFLSHLQTIDSLGLYTTEYKFISASKEPIFDYNIRIEFDTTFLKPKPPFGFFKFEGGQHIHDHASGYDMLNKTIYSIGSIKGKNTITFFIVSETPVKAKIYGVDGKAE